YTYASQLHSMVVPPGGYFVFSWRNPEHPTVWVNSEINPIGILDDGQPVGTMSYARRDGPDGDPGFNPYGLPDTNTADFAYAFTVPRVTTGTNLTFLARADGSAESIRLKLDGGIDLNGVNHGGGDPRDNPPALSTDVFLGYEGMSFIHRAKEKFAAVVSARNVIGSPGAETYEATIGQAGLTVTDGSGLNSSGDTASWVFHDPTQDNQPDPPTRESSLQFSPAPESAAGQPVTVWVKTGYQNEINRAYLYYTTDGATYPEGAAGQGKGSTQVVALQFHSNGPHDGTGLPDWWSGTISALPNGTVLRYKIGAYLTTAASVFPSDANAVALKKTMETLFRIQGFNATTIDYRPHNDYGETATGLAEGFHVLRARSFLNRDSRASIFHTAVQTFYHDVQRPAGEIKFPATDGESVGGQQYGVVVRTDPIVTEVWYHIDDADANNDDVATGVANGNGNGFELFTDSNNNGQYDLGEPFIDLNTNGVWDASIGPAWIRALEVTPTTSISSAYPREWRFNYVNIPAGGGGGAIQVRLRELSSADRGSLAAWQTGDDVASHFTTLTRGVVANGPLTRMFVAFPAQDGDTVGVPYTMKVYFTQSLAAGLGEAELIDQFLVKIQSSESSRIGGGVPQDRATYDILYDEGGPDYFALAYPLPNLFNDQPDFLHGIEVTLTQPGKPVLTATRLVKAYPAPEAPYIAIVNPVSIDSDGRPFQIVLPDVPSPTPDQRQYDVRVATGVSGTNVTIAFDYAPPDYTNTLDGMVAVTNFVEGSTRFWDFTWINLVAGRYTFTATVTTSNETTGAATRTTSVVFRELVDTDSTDADDDDDGLMDVHETTAEPWPDQRLPGSDPPPKANSDAWTNGDIHIHYAYGFSDPLSPDT
ncbi:hypothetical protein HQ590_01900, partial [bacterium]|nr:hypothetical protein [bacterium]